jgi:hypothetical protein
MTIKKIKLDTTITPRVLEADIVNKRINPEYVLAKVLTMSNEFASVINKLRKQDDSIVSAYHFCKEYGLTPNWIPSIQQAIEKGTIFVPPPYNPIHIYSPNLKTAELFNTRKHSAIFFTNKTSKRKLIEWIRNNKELEKVLDSLPPMPSNKTTPRQILIGQLVFFEKKNGVKGYASILKSIEDKLSADKSLHDFWELFNNTVGVEDLKNAEKALKKILPEKLYP